MQWYTITKFFSHEFFFSVQQKASLSAKTSHAAFHMSLINSSSLIVGANDSRKHSWIITSPKCIERYTLL